MNCKFRLIYERRKIHGVAPCKKPIQTLLVSGWV